MGSDRGQAHILAVVAAGIAASVIAGLVVAQDALLARARLGRAGEAAVQAAGAVVADEHLLFVSGWVSDEEGPTTAEERAFLADPGLADRALAAARAIAIENRAPPPTAVSIEDLGRDVSVTLEHGQTYRVTIEKARCCRR